MAYIKEKLSDIEKEFIPDYVHIKNPILDIFPELPISIRAIQNCVVFFSNEGIGEELEKVEITLDVYNPKNPSHSFKMDYLALSDVLDIDVFKNELTKNVELQEMEFKEDLYNLLKKCVNEIVFKISLRKAVESLKQSIVNLENIQANNIQRTVIGLYKKSYARVLKELKTQYQEFVPELFFSEDLTDEESYKRYFEGSSAVQKFIGFERKLLDEGYLNEDFVWQKDKITLIKFFYFAPLKG